MDEVSSLLCRVRVLACLFQRDLHKHADPTASFQQLKSEILDALDRIEVLIGQGVVPFEQMVATSVSLKMEPVALTLRIPVENVAQVEDEWAGLLKAYKLLRGRDALK